MLETAPEKICYIIVKARAFDAKVAVEVPDRGSNPSDESDVEILEDRPDDPTLHELETALSDLNEDERTEVLALMWLGRGDYTMDGWDEALATARDTLDEHFVTYMTGTPLLGDHLEEGLSEHGYSCQDFEMGRL